MLKLITHPNPILDKSLPEFDFNNPVIDPRELEEQMVMLMAQENGIGLAANQVGVEARVFVMKTSKLEGVYTPFALFNPKIIVADPEEEIDEEGCLSFPGLFFKVKRPAHVVTEFFDRDGNQCIIRFDGIDARCFLHELDHLNGVCYISKISKPKLDLAVKKQRKLLNGRTKRRTTIDI
jgi:peptide deformylase